MKTKNKQQFMAEATIERMEKKIEIIEKNVERICEILEDDWEITPQIKKEVEKARKAPRSSFISHEELKKRIMR